MSIRQLIKNESGFRCFQVEEMVPFIVVGIVLAISIPLFADYNRKAHVKEIRSHLIKAADAQELYFAKNGSYKHVHPVPLLIYLGTTIIRK